VQCSAVQVCRSNTALRSYPMHACMTVHELASQELACLYFMFCVLKECACVTGARASVQERIMASRLKTYIHACCSMQRCERSIYIYMPGASPGLVVMLIILVFLTRFDSLGGSKLKTPSWLTHMHCSCTDNSRKTLVAIHSLGGLAI
jgi:hypothetical protein